MKLIRSALVVALSIAAASCASLNEGLKNVNEGLSKVTGKPNEPASGDTTRSSPEGISHESTLSIKGGGVRTINFKIPPKHCAPDEYVNKYERGYVSRWNERINGKQMKYAAPKTAADKAAYADLEAKTLILPKGLPIPSPEEMKRRGRLAADCTDIDASAYAEAQAYNDILAEFPD